YLPVRRGDTTMMQTWKPLGWPALLALALTTPAFAADGPSNQKEDAAAPKPSGTDALAVKQDDFKELVKKLEQIRLELNNLSVPRRLEESVLKEELAKMREQIMQLQEEVRNLRRAAPLTRESAYPLSQSARIRLVNTYSQPVTVVVNGQS